MISYPRSNPMISEKDKVLLKKYNLLSLLENQRFIQYAASLIEPYQARYGKGIPLSVAVDLISTAAKYEPEVGSSLMNEDQSIQTHLLFLFSLAAIEKLADMGYLGPMYPKREKPAEGQFEPRRRIFVSHGRNTRLVREIIDILLQLGFEVVALQEQPSGAMTILEKLETYSDVGYAIVVITRDETMPDSSLARSGQNVVFEFGYFVGLLGRDRVVCLIQEGVAPPSDIGGMRYIRFNESVNEVRNEIVRELSHAGYSVRGRTARAR